MSGPLATRRQLLAGAGGALAGTAMPGAAAQLASASAPQAAGTTVILQSRHFTLPDDVRARLGAHGAEVVMLEDDPVRMWRGPLAAQLADRGTRLLGVTRWPEFLLVQGLAAESRRRVRYQRLDASGALVWLIG